jgi:hypothetical protein
VPSATHTTVGHKQVEGSVSENLKANKDQDNSDESDAVDDGDLGRIQPEPAEECKLVQIPSVLVQQSVSKSFTGDMWALRSSWYEATSA